MPRGRRLNTNRTVSSLPPTQPGWTPRPKRMALNVANLTVSASQCTCGTVSAPVSPACASNYCTDDPQGNYVIVNAQAPVNIITKFPRGSFLRRLRARR